MKAIGKLLTSVDSEIESSASHPTPVSGFIFLSIDSSFLRNLLRKTGKCKVQNVIFSIKIITGHLLQ